MLTSLPGLDGYGPVATPAMDDNGALYGTTLDGSVFKLTPSGDNWILSQLGNAGPQMTSSVVVDGNGAVYGTDAWGGSHNDGFVFEIMP